MPARTRTATGPSARDGAEVHQDRPTDAPGRPRRRESRRRHATLPVRRATPASGQRKNRQPSFFLARGADSASGPFSASAGTSANWREARPVAHAVSLPPAAVPARARSGDTGAASRTCIGRRIRRVDLRGAAHWGMKLRWQSASGAICSALREPQSEGQNESPVKPQDSDPCAGGSALSRRVALFTVPSTDDLRPCNAACGRVCACAGL
jgi:hypothetical protein